MPVLFCLSLSLSLYVCIHVYRYICIYIYIEREREERVLDRHRYLEPSQPAAIAKEAEAHVSIRVSPEPWLLRAFSSGLKGSSFSGLPFLC